MVPKRPPLCPCLCSARASLSPPVWSPFRRQLPVKPSLVSSKGQETPNAPSHGTRSSHATCVPMTSVSC